MRPRPSSLELSLHCTRAPWLDARFLERTEAAQAGSSVDSEISTAIATGDLPIGASQAARHCWDWWRSLGGVEGLAEVHVQGLISLTDPEDGSELTRGTPDLWCIEQDNSILVVDWKKAEQWRAGLLPPVNQNPQLLSYLASLMLSRRAVRGRVVVVPWDDDGVYPQWSKTFTAADVLEIIDMVKSAPEVDPAGPEPQATMGDHCFRCYRRRHCSAYLLPAADPMPKALAPLSAPGELARADAVAALVWMAEAKAALKRGQDLVDQVDDVLRAHALQCGPIVDGSKKWGPTPTKGRRSGPSVEELEQSGRSELIKIGKPGVRFGWTKL